MAYLTGFHAIEEEIKARQNCGVLLYAKPGPRAKEIVELALSRGVRVERVGTHDLDRISATHRGIVLEVLQGGGSAGGAGGFTGGGIEGGELSLEGFLEKIEGQKQSTVVVLDEITDPHNFGAIIRSCEQFGVDLIITRNRRSAKGQDVISKASAGAVSWIARTEVPNLPRAIKELKDAGFWIYAADTKGESIFKHNFNKKCALVLGSEGKGISRLLRESADVLVAIPNFGHVDSLNVSVAAGIFLYEIARQGQ